MTPELRTAVVEALREAALRGHGPDTDAEDNASDLLAALERAGFDVVRVAAVTPPVLFSASDREGIGVKLDLDAIKSAAKAATPGRWQLHHGWEQDDPGLYVTVVGADGPLIYCPDQEMKSADVAFVAEASPDVLVALVTRLEAAEALVVGWLWAHYRETNLCPVCKHVNPLLHLDGCALAAWFAARGGP